jgi:hypothetical protein
MNAGREWVSQSIPALVFIAMTLFADRVMRREVIIDSSSLMSTVFAAHLLNVCRCGMVVARVLEPRDNLHNTKEMGGFLAALSLAHATSMPQESAPSVYIYPHRMVPESIEAAEAALKVRESQASISAMNTHVGNSQQTQESSNSSNAQLALESLQQRSPHSHHMAMAQLIKDDSNVMHMLRRTRWWKAPPLPIAWWQEVMLSSAYAVASLLMVIGIDACSWIVPRMYQCQVVHNDAATFQHVTGLPGVAGAKSRSTAHRNRPGPVTRAAVLKLACWHSFHSPDACKRKSKEDDDIEEDSRVSSNKGHPHQPSTVSDPPMVVQATTVVAHLVLIALISRTGVPHTDVALFMAPSRIMARSFAFLVLTVLWTYAFGMWHSEGPDPSEPCNKRHGGEPQSPSCSSSVSESSYSARANKERHRQDRLGTKPNAGAVNDAQGGFEVKQRRRNQHAANDMGLPRHNEPHTQQQNGLPQSHALPLQCPIAARYVQSFTPCQLRFTVLLLTDGWIMGVACLSMGAVVAERMYRIACFSGADCHLEDNFIAAATVRAERAHSNCSNSSGAEEDLPNINSGSIEDYEDDICDRGGYRSYDAAWTGMNHQGHPHSTQHKKQEQQQQQQQRHKRSHTMTGFEVQHMMGGTLTAQEGSEVLHGPRHKAIGAGEEDRDDEHDRRPHDNGSDNDDETMAMFAMAKEAAGIVQLSSSASSQHSHVMRTERLGEML